MTPLDLKLISSYDLVEVEPLCSLKDIQLVSGHVSGCTPLSITKLPYFMALPLKDSSLLKIRLPVHLSLEYLRKKVEEEETKPEYSLLNDTIFDLGKEMVRNSYNAGDVQGICSLLDQLKEVRFRKTLKGLQGLDGSTLNLDNLTIFEFNEVKGHLLLFYKFLIHNGEEEEYEGIPKE